MDDKAKKDKEALDKLKHEAEASLHEMMRACSAFNAMLESHDEILRRAGASATALADLRRDRKDTSTLINELPKHLSKELATATSRQAVCDITNVARSTQQLFSKVENIYQHNTASLTATAATPTATPQTASAAATTPRSTSSQPNTPSPTAVATRVREEAGQEMAKYTKENTVRMDRIAKENKSKPWPMWKKVLAGIAIAIGCVVAAVVIGVAVLSGSNLSFGGGSSSEKNKTTDKAAPNAAETYVQEARQSAKAIEKSATAATLSGTTPSTPAKPPTTPAPSTAPTPLSTTPKPR